MIDTKSLFMPYFISFGSSIVLLIIGFILNQLGADASMIQIVVVGYDITANIFILLTMIPIGIAVIVFVVLYNALAPIIVPLITWIWNNFVYLMFQLANFNFVPLQASSIQSLDITTTINAVVSLFTATKQFLLETTGISYVS